MNQPINGTEPGNARAVDTQAAVHQAAGMISAQLDVPIPVAMKRMQDYATDHRQTLTDVAADVVARRLRFDADETD